MIHSRSSAENQELIAGAAGANQTSSGRFSLDKTWTRWGQEHEGNAASGEQSALCCTFASQRTGTCSGETGTRLKVRAAAADCCD